MSANYCLIAAVCQAFYQAGRGSEGKSQEADKDTVEHCADDCRDIYHNSQKHEREENGAQNSDKQSAKRGTSAFTAVGVGAYSREAEKYCKINNGDAQRYPKEGVAYRDNSAYEKKRGDDSDDNACYDGIKRAVAVTSAVAFDY